MERKKQNEETTSIDFEQIKDRALRLLARRDHSAYELKMKLRQRLKLENDVFDQLLTYLKGLGYMAKEDDLAQRWVREWQSEGRGRHWINGKLRTKGLPPVSLTDDENEHEAAKSFLEKKLAGKTIRQLNRQERARVARALVSRGFSMSLVASLLK
jgi:regulatory protein